MSLFYAIAEWFAILIDRLFADETPDGNRDWDAPFNEENN